MSLRPSRVLLLSSPVLLALASTVVGLALIDRKLAQFQVALEISTSSLQERGRTMSALRAATSDTHQLSQASAVLRQIMSEVSDRATPRRRPSPLPDPVLKPDQVEGPDGVRPERPETDRPHTSTNAEPISIRLGTFGSGHTNLGADVMRRTAEAALAGTPGVKLASSSSSDLVYEGNVLSLQQKHVPDGYVVSAKVEILVFNGELRIVGRITESATVKDGPEVVKDAKRLAELQRDAVIAATEHALASHPAGSFLVK